MAPVGVQLHEKHLARLDASAMAVAKASRQLNQAVKKCGVVAGAYAADAGCDVERSPPKGAAPLVGTFKDSVGDKRERREGGERKEEKERGG